MDELLARIEAAQKEGLKITRRHVYLHRRREPASMPACRPGRRTAVIPPCSNGCAIPETRDKDRRRSKTPTRRMGKPLSRRGLPDNILLVGFKSEKLKPLTGKSLAEVAKMRGKDPIETIMDLIAEDESRIDTIYFLMSEENVKKEMAKPWISFGSDEASQAPEGVFLKSNPHPRAYGNFARLLGKYVREEKVISLPEAIRRLTALPADNLGLDQRGLVRGRNVRRCGRVRSGDDRRSRHLRETASIRGRDETCFCERRAGLEGWRAHRREAGSRPVGSGKSESGASDSRA